MKKKEITAEAVEERRKKVQAEAHKRWADKNKEYLRQYRKAWRERYKEEHGCSYETALARRKARAELESEAIR